MLHQTCPPRGRRLSHGELLLTLGVVLACTATAPAQWESSKVRPFLKTNPKFLAAFRDVVAPASASWRRSAVCARWRMKRS